MRRLGKQVLLLLLTAVMLVLVNTSDVSAETCEIRKVEDLDNEVCPPTKTFSIAGSNVVTAIEFTLPETGTVKGYLEIGMENVGSGKMWISSDYEGNNVLSNVIPLTKSEYITECLDAGTYYIQVRWSQIIYNAGIAIMYEPSSSEETYDVSKINLANPLTLNEFKKGFLTSNTPKDYYQFTVDELAYVDIQYSFDTALATGTRTGEMKLYNSNQIEIGACSYDVTDKGLKSEQYKLEPGTYYISMSGLRGATALCVEPMYYHTMITPDTKEWTNKNVSVKIDTTIDFKSIEVIRYNVTKADLTTNSLWNPETTSNKYVETNGTTFVARKNGTYSIRIKDGAGEYTLYKIKINNIDKTAPKISGVKKDEYYNTAKTIVWSDAGCGIKKATLNGKAVTSGVKITKDGEYELRVYDQLGNKSVVKFYVDATKPTIQVIEDIDKYYTMYSITFLDNYSGVEKITVNGIQKSKDENPFCISVAGIYEVKVWDVAGNVATKTLTIK